MSSNQSQKQKKIAYSVCGVLSFICLFFLVLILNHDVKTLGFKEVDAYISNYSVMGKVPRQYVLFKDDSGTEYSSSYVCENGTKPLRSKVKLFIREERFTIPFLYTRDINNVVNGPVLACNPR